MDYNEEDNEDKDSEGEDNEDEESDEDEENEDEDICSNKKRHQGTAGTKKKVSRDTNGSD